MQSPSVSQSSPQSQLPGGVNSPSNPVPIAPLAAENDSVELAVFERSVLPKDIVTLTAQPQDEPDTVSVAEEASEASPEKGEESKRGGDGEDINKELSDQQEKQLRSLEARDAEVKAHERAHKSAGGQYTGSISYDYQQGPDGKRYAVGGEVSIDVSPVSGDPEKTIEKMNVVKAAALAPADPSSQDRRVAAQASQIITAARAEQNSPSQNDEKAAEENEGVSTLRINQRNLESYGSVSTLESDNQNSTRQFVDDIA